jgi:DNA repair protein RadC
MARLSKTGHRQRLRERFLAGETSAQTDAGLLELLLAYAIPRVDVQPLATQLLATFGNLPGVLAADGEALCTIKGIKGHAVTLLKLTDWIRTHYPARSFRQARGCTTSSGEPTLFDLLSDDKTPHPDTTGQQPKPRKAISPRRGTAMFGKAVLKEAIELLPHFPDTESLPEVGAFLRSHLHFSAEQTRQRYANYIIRRMFPEGYADQALRVFATVYAERQELREVCFYRFCKAEPLMFSVIEELLLPAIGTGRLPRSRLRDYLSRRFPEAKSIKDCSQAIVEAFGAGSIAKVERNTLAFAYREVALPSFAFVLHSEFPEPGIYDIEKIARNQAIRAMLWNPERLLPSLYELRNQGIIAKVSAIDSIRLFTTKWNLPQFVQNFVSESVTT